MRIAVFADVHGNLLALEAVLADIASRSPDITVNLGDWNSAAALAEKSGSPWARAIATGYAPVP
ncbi:MAG TPA: metallophosphoesterase [Gemmatimonadaceae bacterium]|nr:metallophosphoesterase [Gemmatimonadaceae bacterium]